ncbi:hypothetical protein IPL68_04680 [Candidatus Saccharibacteria bacterium]|nr:MAG: hypothetical protein IPL68_04680 [Candidatus Saccharibacteria bacterium]
MSGTKVADVWKRVPEPLQGIREAGRGALYGAIGRNPAERSQRIAALTTNPKAALLTAAKDALQEGILGARTASVEQSVNPKHFDLGVRLSAMATRAILRRPKSPKPNWSRA